MTSRKNKVIGKGKRNDDIFKKQTKKNKGDQKISEPKEKKGTEQEIERRVERKRRENKTGSTKGNRKEQAERKVTD